jgi:cytoskeletal protein CcmA (bactofilin family)
VFNPIRSHDPKNLEAHTKPTSDAISASKLENPNPMAEIITGKNVLSADVEIKGSIKFQNELTIDGKVEGEITSAGILTVGENAEIRGEIKTKSVTVLGKVHGNITVDERCELKARAVLQGDLKAARLVIEEGATFVGKSEVTPVKGANRPAPEAPRPPEAAKAPAPVR